jgi:hypothetical protein
VFVNRCGWTFTTGLSRGKKWTTRVFTDRIDRRASWLVAQLALAACMFAAPARAAVVADFNGDGQPDPVTAASAPGRIFVTVSGLDTQVLHIADRILAVVAADIDHDGRLDLSTLSVRRGLSVWLNRGGHFVKARRAHRQHGITIERSGPTARPADSDERIPSTSATSDSNQFANSTAAYRLAALPAGGSLISGWNPVLTTDSSRALRSRAPPALAPS